MKSKNNIKTYFLVFIMIIMPLIQLSCTNNLNLEQSMFGIRVGDRLDGTNFPTIKMVINWFNQQPSDVNLEELNQNVDAKAQIVRYIENQFTRLDRIEEAYGYALQGQFQPLIAVLTDEIYELHDIALVLGAPSNEFTNPDNFNLTSDDYLLNFLFNLRTAQIGSDGNNPLGDIQMQLLGNLDFPTFKQYLANERSNFFTSLINEYFIVYTDGSYTLRGSNQLQEDLKLTRDLLNYIKYYFETNESIAPPQLGGNALSSPVLRNFNTFVRLFYIFSTTIQDNMQTEGYEQVATGYEDLMYSMFTPPFSRSQYGNEGFGFDMSDEGDDQGVPVDGYVEEDMGEMQVFSLIRDLRDQNGEPIKYMYKDGYLSGRPEKKAEIKVWQSKLNQQMGSDLKDDGYYGPLTSGVVAHAQARFSLNQNGKITTENLFAKVNDSAITIDITNQYAWAGNSAYHAGATQNDRDGSDLAAANRGRSDQDDILGAMTGFMDNYSNSSLAFVVQTENPPVPNFVQPVAPRSNPKKFYYVKGTWFNAYRRTYRRHAGSDTKAAKGTPVVAMADGVVVETPREFYASTCQIVIQHSGFVIRYGEVDCDISKSIYKGAQVNKGQVIGKVGRLYMVHIEKYRGTREDCKGRSLTQRSTAPFQRCSTLVDGTNDLMVAQADYISERKSRFALIQPKDVEEYPIYKDLIISSIKNYDIIKYPVTQTTDLVIQNN